MPEPPEERTADNPWPEWPNVKKTDYGQAEAIEVFGADPRRYKTTVKAIQCDESGAVQSLTIVKTERQRNEQGRMVFVNQPGSEEEIPCDLLLVAMGFAGCTQEIAEAFDLPLQNGKVAAEGHHVKDHLFTAGDMHIGQSLVVRAIKEGLDCAEAVDQYLIG
jgi:glutamate synthase (NADPH/NADH) small chain